VDDAKSSPKLSDAKSNSYMREGPKRSPEYEERERKEFDYVMLTLNFCLSNFFLSSCEAMHMPSA